MKKLKFSNVYMFFVLLILYTPVIILIAYSFNEGRNYTVFEGFSLKWYKSIWENRSLMEALGNSILLAIISSLVAGIIGTCASYGFSRRKFFGDKLITYMSMLTIMIPEIILGMVYMAFFTRFNIPLGMGALIIAHTAFCIPYVLLMVNSRVEMLDYSLVEAAYDLGASKIYTFFTVILPELLPAIASGILLSFAMSFDDVIISLFLTGARTNTLPVKLNSQLKTMPTPEINVLFSIIFFITVGIVVLLGVLSKRKNMEE